MKSEEEIIRALENDDEAINKLCRICLSKSVEGFSSLFEVHGVMSFSEKVWLCTRVQFNAGDGLPNVICATCSNTLDIADSFRAQCEHSDLLLKNVVNSRRLEKALKREPPPPEIKEEPGVKLEDDFDDRVSYLGDSIDDSEEDAKELDSLALKIETKSSEDERFSKKRGKRKLNKGNFEKVDCPQCFKELSNKYTLKTHLKEVHYGIRGSKTSVKKYKCDECDYCSHRSQALIYHKRTHTGEKPYKCSECGRCFAQPGSLSNHVRGHSDKMYFTCPTCGKQFKTKNKFDKHKLVHTTEKKFVCTICNKGCKTKVTFDQHTKRHYNIKDYSCDICGMTFVTGSELINHSFKHKEVKDFECPVCGFKTKKKSSLKVHVARHTGILPFNCAHCEWSFFTRAELIKHIKSHTKEKKYSCPECDEKFIHSQSINKHVLRKHGKVFKYNDTVDRRVVELVTRE